MREGLCKCGCGNPPAPGKKFLHGHWAKTREGKQYLHSVRYKDARTDHGDGYFTKFEDGNGHKLEHRLIAEKALGKPLPRQAELHHADHNKGNNTNSNLVICQDRGYHRLLHQRENAKNACGHANWRKCTFCGEYDDPENLYIPPNRGTVEHRRCGNEYRRARKLAKI